MAVVYNVVINQGADWYINYFYKQPAAITNIVGNGTTVTFTADNGLTPGQVVSIDGVIPSQFNLQDVVVATATSTQFTVTNGATGLYISGGIATAPYNITGFSAAMQLRSLPESPDAVLTLTTDNGGITITGATGEIAVHATAAQTGNINEGPYVYDLEITSNNNIVTRVAQGQAIVSAQVTR
jgi:hypothetical protein